MTNIEGREFSPINSSKVELSDGSQLTLLMSENDEQAYQRVTPDGRRSILRPITIDNGQDMQRFAEADNLMLILTVNRPAQQTTEIARVSLGTAFKLFNAPTGEVPEELKAGVIDHTTYQDIDTADTPLQKGIVLAGLTIKEVLRYRDRRLNSRARGLYITDQLTPEQFQDTDFITSNPQDLRVGGYIAAVPSAVFQETSI